MNEMQNEIREELQFHIDRQTEANILAGMAPEEARRAAIRTFGQVNTIEEQCGEMHSGAALETFLEDARIGARHLRRNPSFAFTVIATLAVAVAACATMFSVVDTVLLRPIGFPAPERLHAIYQTSARIERGSFSPPDFLDIREQSRTLSAVAAYHYGTWNLAGRETESVRGLRATAGLFEALGVHPAYGRPFAKDERDAVVISHGLAVRQFGSAPAAVNRTILLDGKSALVTGVMPPSFRFPSDEVLIWTPLNFEPDVMTQRGAHYLRVIGRVAPNATPEAAQRELDLIGHRLATLYADTNEGSSFIAERLDAAAVRDVRRGLLILLGAVAVLALIAAANVANLLLTRAATRGREWAVRSALGASRFRVMRQFLTESLVFGFAGGAAGLLLTWLGVRLIVRFGPGTIPRLGDATMNARVLIAGIAASVAMSLLFAILPALSASRGADAGELAGAGRIAGGLGATRLRAAMTIAQLALAVTLLCGAALLVRSFQRVLTVDPGFDPRNVLTFSVVLPSVRYDGTQRVNAFHDALLDRLRATPGIESAGAVSHLPLSGGRFWSDFRINGVENDEWQAAVYVADEGYFRAMRIPLVRGGQSEGILVSESAAKKYWPDRDPIGAELRFGASGGYERYEGTIAGVVADVHQQGREEEVEPTFYVPLRKAGLDSVTYVVRSTTDPAALIASTRQQVAAVDPTVAVAEVATMDEHLGESVARRRFQVFLLSFFAAAALLLASLGVYGVVAYSVAQRTREIGVRMALGASVAGVFRMIVGQALRLVAPAVVVGLILAIALRRLIAALLFGVSPTDVATLSAVAIAVLAVSLLAAAIPAKRAASVDPTVALRYE
jgi:predicted permease